MKWWRALDVHDFEDIISVYIGLVYEEFESGLVSEVQEPASRCSRISCVMETFESNEASGSMQCDGNARCRSET